MGYSANTARRATLIVKMAAKTPKEQKLQQALDAGKRGDHARARKLLLELLRSDNREPLYWLLMSTAVELREERIYCLQNVLFLDPENGAAKHDLELLGAPIPQANVPAFVPEETEDWQTKEIAAPKLRKRKRKTSKDEPWSLNWILGTLGIGLVVILLGYYAAENDLLGVVFNPPATPSGQAATQPVGPTATPTLGQAAQQATSTQQIVLVPNDPQSLLAETYTPTPIYVNTPHPESQAYAQGLAALASQDWGAAQSFFQDAMAANSQSGDAAYYLGVAYLGAGDLEAATTAFNQAIRIQPSFAPGYLGRAQVGLQQDSPDVISDLNTAILLDANYVDAYLERSDFNIARNDLNAAQSDAATAEGLAPDSARVQYQKARVALAQLNYAAALQASQRANELDVTLLPDYLAIAEAQQGLHQYSDFDRHHAALPHLQRERWRRLAVLGARVPG